MVPESMTSKQDCRLEEEAILIKSSVPEETRKGLAAVDLSKLHLTGNDKFLYATLLCTVLGDAVEIYLPGVFTQSVSEELGVTDRLEGYLAASTSVFMFISSLIIAPTLNASRFSRRRVLMFSLYLTIMSTIFSAVVPDYKVLLISRCIRGACVGLNFSMLSVFFATQASAYDVYNLGRFLAVLMFAVGGGWSAVLGYLLLDTLGWRVLIVSCSVPLLVPPLTILHFVLTEESIYTQKSNVDEALQDDIEVPNLKCRLVKGCIANFINFLQGWGSIILAPALIRYSNLMRNRESEIVDGGQLLILALIFGGVKMVGRVVGYFLLKSIPFRVIHVSVSLVIAASYLAIAIDEGNLIVTVLGMGVANLAFCISRIDLSLLETDKYFFGTKNLANAGFLMMAFGSLGAAVGSIFAAFLETRIAVLTCLVLSCVQVVVFLSITECE